MSILWTRMTTRARWWSRPLCSRQPTSCRPRSRASKRLSCRARCAPCRIRSTRSRSRCRRRDTPATRWPRRSILVSSTGCASKSTLACSPTRRRAPSLASSTFLASSSSRSTRSSNSASTSPTRSCRRTSTRRSSARSKRSICARRFDGTPSRSPTIRSASKCSLPSRPPSACSLSSTSSAACPNAPTRRSRRRSFRRIRARSRAGCSRSRPRGVACSRTKALSFGTTRGW
mmetsp:Transcript_13170/g.32862  ORF Transcript_13170/g.32862 Transcript_13170/m.32862 type:complete len:231 (+) Transcript_13170:1072-1764(+)